MENVAATSLSTLWQSYAALVVSFFCWFLTTFVAGAYVAVFQPSGLTLWTLAVAGWCGVFFSHKACEFFFPHYTRHAVFFMFVIASAMHPLLGYLSDATPLEQIGRLAQTLATLATAYPLFCQRGDTFPADPKGDAT